VIWRGLVSAALLALIVSCGAPTSPNGTPTLRAITPSLRRAGGPACGLPRGLCWCSRLPRGLSGAPPLSAHVGEACWRSSKEGTCRTKLPMRVSP